MDNKFLKLCSKSIKANRNRFGRDFAVFSKKQNKKTRQLLKTKRANTFGNYPVTNLPNSNHNKNINNKNNKLIESIDKLEEKTKENLLNARKLRRKYDIYVFPESETTPLPIFKFKELEKRLNVNKTVCLNLKKWKIKRPLPVQMQVIPIMIKGNDLQCCAPTGSGKTLAFLIPIITILQRTIDINNCNAFCNDDDDGNNDDNNNDDIIFNNIKCLICAPTTVLAHQLYREFIKYSNGLNIGIYLLDENINNNHNLIHIMISTPNTFTKFINKNQINCNKIEILVLDEADELFDIDKNLHLNDIELILSLCNNPNIQKSFFSATLNDKIMNLSSKYLNDSYKISIGHGICGAFNVVQELIYCGDERGKFIELLKIIENGILRVPVLIFVSDNKRILSLKKQIINYQSHLIVEGLHSDLSIADRNNIIKKFKNEEIWFLICNDLLSRGMDFLNVENIINYDFPVSSEQYIHRIGRTGRSDKCGKSYTFWSDVDNKLLSIVIDVMKQSNQINKLPKWLIDSVNNNKINKINNKQKKKSKIGITERGPIRRGGEYVYGTSVLKTGNKKTRKQKRRQKYFKNKMKHKRKKKKSNLTTQMKIR